MGPLLRRGVNTIMPTGNEIVRERQLAIRRELDRRGISLKAVSFDSGVPYSTLLSYFPGERDREPATISGAAIYGLCAAIPADLISLLLPAGFIVVRVPEGVDHDEASASMVEYLAEKQRAHHPESEAGPAIGPGEDGVLRGKLAVVQAAA